MIKNWLFLAVILFPLSVPGQQGNTLPELDSLYVKTIRGRIDLLLSSGHKYFEVNSKTQRIKDIIQVDIFYFMTRDELIDQALREKKVLQVYFIYDKIISPDTVDVNIGYYSLTAKRGLLKRKATIAHACGGTEGYVPSQRFVLNSMTKRWERTEFIKPGRAGRRK
jgi:hypothetical protein